ncbi:MAG: hypothetical protein AMXMBFR33_11820 [Candidatus Xenobia bacterium]
MKPWACLSLASLLAIMSLLAGQQSSFELLRAGAASRPLVEAGEAWRLLSAGSILTGGWVSLALAFYTLATLGLSLERAVGPWRLLAVFCLGSLLATGLALAWTPVRLVPTGVGALLALVTAELWRRRRLAPEALPWLILALLLALRGSLAPASLAGGLAGLLPLGLRPAKILTGLLLVCQAVTLGQAVRHPSSQSYPIRTFETAHFRFQHSSLLRRQGSRLVGPGFTLEVESVDNGQQVDVGAQMARMAKRFATSGQELRDVQPEPVQAGGRTWLILGGTLGGVTSRIAFALAGTRVYRVSMTAAPEDAAEGESALQQALKSFEMPGAPPPEASPPPAVPAEAALQKAQALMASRSWKEAEAELTRAVELKPGWAEAHLARAMVRLAQDRPDGALADVEVSVEKNPMDPRALLLRGKILGQQKEYQRARADLDRVLELVSGQAAVEATALRERATLRLDAGDPAGAVQDLRRALELQPDQTELYARLAEALEKCGQGREAEQARQMLQKLKAR